MPLKILIIDDEPKIGASLSGFLADMGHQAKICYDGASGLQAAIDEYFDLIFLDVMLPGKNGLQVLEQLKRAKPEQKVIMISGHADLEVAVKATKLGAYNFLEKPLNPDKVLLEVGIKKAAVEFSHKQDHLKGAGVMYNGVCLFLLFHQFI